MTPETSSVTPHKAFRIKYRDYFRALASQRQTRDGIDHITRMHLYEGVEGNKLATFLQQGIEAGYEHVDLDSLDEEWKLRFPNLSSRSILMRITFSTPEAPHSIPEDLQAMAEITFDNSSGVKRAE